GVGRKMSGAEEASFLLVERNEDDGPLGLMLLQDETFGYFQEHGHAAGVIIGPRKQPVAVFAEMIEMGGQQDPFILQLRVAARQKARHILTNNTRFLVVRVF